MSALDNVHPEQFLHASPHRIARGTMMTPETNAAHGANFEISSGNTYFTTSRKIANNMGMAAANGLARRTGVPINPLTGYRVYRVQPMGRYYPDQNAVEHAYESPDPVKVLGRQTYTAPLERRPVPGSFAHDRLMRRRARLSMEEY